jgi:hypothetical protein
MSGFKTLLYIYAFMTSKGTTLHFTLLLFSNALFNAVSVEDKWMCIEHRWNGSNRVQLKYWRKILSSDAFSATNSTENCLGLKPGLLLSDAADRPLNSWYSLGHCFSCICYTVGMIGKRFMVRIWRAKLKTPLSIHLKPRSKEIQVSADVFQDSASAFLLHENC